MGTRLTYNRNAERPAAKFWVFDDDGTLVDFSGYTFVFKVGAPGYDALLTKTSNITGGIGSGTEPDGTSNITINWTAGELDIAPGLYKWQMTCTTSSLDRVYEGTIKILEEIS